jgi:hypothetical protein
LATAPPEDDDFIVKNVVNAWLLEPPSAIELIGVIAVRFKPQDAQRIVSKIALSLRGNELWNEELERGEDAMSSVIEALDDLGIDRSGELTRSIYATNQSLDEFTKATAKTAEGALKLLFNQALVSLPVAPMRSINAEYTHLSKIWTEGNELLAAPRDQLRTIMGKTLEVVERLCDFMDFTIEAISESHDGTPLNSIAVNTFLKDPIRFVPMRIYRSSDNYYAFGNRPFARI